MILISHRGNLFGPNKLSENHPVQIEKVLQLGYDCEIDLFYLKENKQLFLGHDKPEIRIDLNWIIKFTNMRICLIPYKLMVNLGEEKYFLITLSRNMTEQGMIPVLQILKKGCI